MGWSQEGLWINMVNINVCFACSDAFCKVLSVAIASILENADPDDNINFKVISADITDENKRILEKLSKIKKCTFDFILTNSDEFQNHPSNPINIATVFRLKMASLLSDWDKVIFLDADLIVLTSLKSLMTLDLKENYIAAAVDPGIKIQFDYTKENRELFPDRRFNTGVLVADLAKWREDGMEEKLFSALEWYLQHYVYWPDQNVLNMVFKDATLELSPQYNACPTLKWANCYDDMEAM